MLPTIPKEMLKAVCKMGEGEVCCRYIVADGTGICCAKHEEGLALQINRRVGAGVFVAMGDNCEGLK